MARASRWLIDREVRKPGDWSLLNPNLEPAGWFFEYRNGFYPDTDDTAMVPHGAGPLRSRLRPSRRPCRDGIVTGKHTQAKWTCHQFCNGDLESRGQATMAPGRAIAPSPNPRISSRRPAERGITLAAGHAEQVTAAGRPSTGTSIRDLLTKVPLADHNAMLDPSCPDITARALASAGSDSASVIPQVDRASSFLFKKDRNCEGYPCRIGRPLKYTMCRTAALSRRLWDNLAIPRRQSPGRSRLAFHSRKTRSPRLLEAKAVGALGPHLRHLASAVGAGCHPIRHAPTLVRPVLSHGPRRCQQVSGAWGESCWSYNDPTLTAGQGIAHRFYKPSTFDRPDGRRRRLSSEAVRRGIDYLVRHPSNPTATGGKINSPAPASPKFFYLKYHMYSPVFSARALLVTKNVVTTYRAMERCQRRPKLFMELRRDFDYVKICRFINAE